MALKAFKKQDINEKDLSRGVLALQDNVDKVFGQLQLNPTLTGNLLTGIQFETGMDIYVNHGLGVAYQGYANTRIYDSVGLPLYVESDTENKSKDKYIIFKALGTFKADLWIF